jgi:hypothetical protein
MWYYKALIAGLLGGMFWTGGMLYERGTFMLFKGQVQGAASNQAAVTKAADIKNESATGLISSLQMVHQYYRDNPVVRVRWDQSSCTMSKAIDHPEGRDDTSPGENAETYLSEYSPEETETVAVRLYHLQQRLLAGGVIVQ